MIRRRMGLVLVVFLCLLVVASAGCTKTKKKVVVVGSGTTLNQPPTAVIDSPTGGILSGDVTIIYTLTDVDSDDADIVVRYSTNGGSTWNTCTAGTGGDGTSALAVGTSGTEHTYIWDSVADGVGTSASQSVQVRITPTDKDGTGTAGTASFIVSNVTDDPPTVAITSPTSGTHNGDITITYSIMDVDSDPADVTIEYSTNGGSTWNTPTAGTGGDGITSLATSPAGTTHTFVWDSATDGVGASGDEAVQVMITPSDKDGTGTEDTVSFTVSNVVDEPPTVMISDPTSGTYSGDITITYSLRDVDSDPADITVQYSINGGSSWDTCTAGTGGDGVTSLTTSPAGTAHNFVWDSAADDVGTSGDQAVQVMITPSDKDGTGTEDTVSFTVNQSGGASGDFPVTDPQNDAGGYGTAADFSGMQGTSDASNVYIHVELYGSLDTSGATSYWLVIDSDNSGGSEPGPGDYIVYLFFSGGAGSLLVIDDQMNVLTGTGIDCQINSVGGTIDYTIPRSLVDSTAFGVAAQTVYNLNNADQMPDDPPQAWAIFRF